MVCHDRQQKAGLAISAEVFIEIRVLQNNSEHTHV